VDADPSSNLADALGLKVNKSLGTAREDFFETKGNLPGGDDQGDLPGDEAAEILVESPGWIFWSWAGRKARGATATPTTSCAAIWTCSSRTIPSWS
jgi:hypothetical protein